MLAPITANAILTTANVVPRAEWIECYLRPDTVEVCTIGRGNRVWTAKVWNTGTRIHVKLREQHVPKPD